QELQDARIEAEEKQKMLEEQAAAAPVSAPVTTPTARMAAPDGGYGLHLASFLLQESIAPGLANISNRIPVLVEGKPVKIANATVRGQNFMRLIVGQFDMQSEAVAECRQALMLLDFCEVIAFEGEDY
ncbi:MAG: hypothetical protein HOH19_14630, partial [Kordiimonadaceae bacterium]|nr:hypothetical protein [Kordiimonadaceae bacterium]